MASRPVVTRRTLASVLVAALIAAPLTLLPAGAALAEEDPTAIVEPVAEAPAVEPVVEPVDEPAPAPAPEPEAPAAPVIEESAAPIVEETSAPVAPPAKASRAPLAAAALAMEVPPTAVNNLAATRTANTNIHVTWSAPDSWGTYPGVGYTIEIAPEGSENWTHGNPGGGNGGTGPSVTSYDVTENVDAGTRYKVRMYAYHNGDQGMGPYTTVTEAFPAPGNALGLTGTASATSINVRWNTAGGVGAISYEVEYRIEEDGAVTVQPSSGTSATLSSLTPGSMYLIRVRAKNAGGTSSWSAPIILATSAPTPAGAPLAFASTPSTAGTSFIWTAPASLGTGTLANYLVEYSAAGQETWVTLASPAGTSLSAQIWSGARDFRVSAVTSAGTGAPAYIRAVSAYGKVPSAPVNLTVTGGLRQFSAAFDHPAADPQVIITEYVFNYRKAGETAWLSFSLGRNTSVGVFGGAGTFEVRVASRGPAGTSAYTETLTVVATDAPSAVATIVITPGDGFASISWVAPADNGAAITAYDISVNGVVTTQAASLGTTFTATGLSNGVSVPVQIRAKNSIGTGPYSSVRQATAQGAPLVVTDVTTTRGDGSVTLTWSAPDDQGSAITGYEVRYSTAGGNLAYRTVTTSTATITGLTNDIPYSFGVRALNSVGAGPWSNSLAVTPVVPVAPSVPLDFTSSHAGDVATFSWSASSTAGTEPITSYRLEYRDAGESGWSVAATGIRYSYTHGSWTGLREYRLSAVSAAGTSSYATISALNGAGFRAAAPTALTATTSNGALFATWAAPASDARTPAVTRYHLEYRVSGSGTWLWSSYVTAPAAMLGGLTNGAVYEYRVQGESPAGVTPYSAIQEITVGIPAATEGLSATRGDGSATLAWTAADLRGSALLGYDVQYRTNDEWLDAPRATTTTTEVADLRNGDAYDFRVRAVTAAGAGEWSNVASATPAAAPDAPVVTPTRGNTWVSLAWSAPEANGSDIQSYTVQYRSGETWIDGGSTAVPAAAITELDNGTSYEFRVRAVNDVDAGAWSATVSAIPAGAPSAPVVSAARGDQSATLTWAEPSANGSAISGYQTQYSVADGTWIDAWDATQSGSTITGLENGVSHQFRVRALNGVTVSDWSETVSVTPAGLPAAPVPSVERGDTELFVSWSAPATNGSDITAYVARYRTVSGEWSALDSVTSESTTLTGLVNGSSYEVQVRAANDVGFGDWSETATAIPAGAPGDVRDLDATPIADGLAVSWSAPLSDNGAEITGYEIAYRVVDSGDEFSWITSATTEVALTGLGNNVDYEVKVRALNDAGIGDWNTLVRVTAGNEPTAPRELWLTPGDGTIGVTWVAPAFTGGSAITGYEVAYGPVGSDAAASTVIVTSTSATLTGLDNATEYEVRVRAITDAARGAWSEGMSIYAFAFAVEFETPGGSTPSSVTPGDTILVSGVGSLPGAGVWVELHSTPIELGSTDVADDGSFALTVTIPKDAPLGDHTLYAALGMGGGLIAEASLAITIVAPADVVTPGGDLVVTGVDEQQLAWSLWLALALLLAGVTLAAASRRRALR